MASVLKEKGTSDSNQSWLPLRNGKPVHDLLKDFIVTTEEEGYRYKTPYVSEEHELTPNCALEHLLTFT